MRMCPQSGQIFYYGLNITKVAILIASIICPMRRNIIIKRGNVIELGNGKWSVLVSRDIGREKRNLVAGLRKQTGVNGLTENSVKQSYSVAFYDYPIFITVNWSTLNNILFHPRTSFCSSYHFYQDKCRYIGRLEYSEIGGIYSIRIGTRIMEKESKLYKLCIARAVFLYLVEKIYQTLL